MNLILQPIPFRPHHILCAVGFQGMGYSPTFVENFQEIKKQITENPQTLIKICLKTDSICAPCPHNLGEGTCQKESKIQSLDQRHVSVLGFVEGQVLTWEKAENLLKERMSLEVFHQACLGCPWKELGVCEDALKGLHKFSFDF